MSAATREEALRRLTGPGGPFEIERVRVRGVEIPVYKCGPPTLRAVFEASRAFGPRPFLAYGDETLSFAEAHDAVAGLAHHLAGRYGIAKGDRVAIAMRNYPEFQLAFWATQCLGAIAVPLNAWWLGDELEFALGDSGTRVLIADGERYERLASHLERLPLEGVLVTRPKGELAPGALHWQALLPTLASGLALPPVEIEPDDDSTILYTSGTTGRPKGVMLEHRNIAHNIRVLPPLVDIREGDTWVSILPSWHTYEQTVEITNWGWWSRRSSRSRRLSE